MKNKASKQTYREFYDEGYLCAEYVVRCNSCDQFHTLFTQTDDCPEYYTDVYVLCGCNAKVEFKLPVN